MSPNAPRGTALASRFWCNRINSAMGTARGRSTVTRPLRKQAKRVLGAMALVAVVAACAGPRSGVATRPGGESGEDLQQRLRAARSAFAEHPADPEAAYDFARALDAADSAMAARELCERILGSDPDHAPALSLWSKILYESGEHDRAIADLEAARERLGHLDPVLRIGLALHYEAAGRLAESEREFAAIDSATSAKVYHVLRGEHFLEAGELAAAALQAEPRSAAAHNNWGITRLYAGDPEAAREAFLRALEIDPGQRGALYNLAIVDAFYFFDEDQARQWLARYRATGGVDDPDGLGELLAAETEDTVGEQARR